MTFLDLNMFNNQNLQGIISIGTIFISILGGYIIIRERILKTELKIVATTTYIDTKNELIDSKINELKKDIEEFKQLNKEMNNSLVQNTIAIRELRVVLDLLKQQLVK